MQNLFKSFFYFFTLIVICSACEKAVDTNPVVVKPTSFNININPQTTYQTITGFGAANRMWGTQSLKPTEATKAFGVDENQLGLSIFRVRLSSNKNEWPIIVEAVKEAKKYGAKVLACPWSPPAALKSNKSDIGGHLLPENYKAFKDYINEFIVFMTQNGAPVDVVSIQNEPDWKASYESCDWTADDMINFLKAPGEIIGAKLAAPESLNFNQNMTNALLSNEEASQKFDIVAGHIYGGGLAKFPLAEQKKKEIWMTEFLLNLDTGNTGAAKWNTYSETAKWAESIKMLVSVHDAMTNNWNAYIWWYLQRYYSFIGDGEEGTINGEVLKRGYGFSHYSKFVRPGFVRIGTDFSTNTYLKITAYKKGTQTVVVILNPESNSVKNVQLNGLAATTAIAYTTTEKENLTKQNLTVTSSIVELNVAPSSITTVVINN
ncbi:MULTISPECIES: hypothetical protein [unclassified Arcicella]|uniref:hypothetical protein n=1 Tax=unclassified Arcicella TaxID=2644986 RepID=UPI00285DED87|nr:MULTISPECIES: hypothetical protein [unclassified Arcicella]MDR6562215.1 O-glycosyl hydrolase [Arcicella sp. BE51]MDR6812091.1 O-glycosyl hydrolase [Arcicella sp. BE140]MDR6823402.1 O-glycosyl hydrolase [Arcicella sp. BE139]